MSPWVQMLGWAGLCVVGAGASWADEPPAAGPQRVLTEKGLRREGSAFVLPAEDRVRVGLERLGGLVKENQLALRRRPVRSGMTFDSHSMYLGLWGQRLALN